jgi:hypothetical protein
MKATPQKHAPDALDAMDALSERLVKAQALAWRTYGEEGEVFRRLCNDGQDAYLWALSGLINEAREWCGVLIEQLERERNRGGGDA